MGWNKLDSSGSGLGPVEGSCENDNKASGSKKVGKFLSNWSTCGFSRKTHPHELISYLTEQVPTPTYYEAFIKYFSYRSALNSTNLCLFSRTTSCTKRQVKRSYTVWIKSTQNENNRMTSRNEQNTENMNTRVIILSRVKGTRDENDGFYFGWLDLLSPWLQVLLITLKCSAIADLHTPVLSL
jgi:hypothetical protein